MFQTITHESLEPVAERSPEKKSYYVHVSYFFLKGHINVGEKACQSKKNTRISTDLFHVTVDVHACHTVLVAFEIPFKAGVRLYTDTQR